MPEQRIFEQGHRVRQRGAVTAWAALRWRGAQFFDGVDHHEATLSPVDIVTGGTALRGDPRVRISAAQLAKHEREVVGGIWVTTAHRALLDEVRRHRAVRQGVVDIEMTAAAGLVTFAGFRDYLTQRNGWTGIAQVREAAAMAGLGCRSPQEVRMVLTWMLDAGLPRPLCNQPVFDRAGRLIAIPDLLDVEAGCVGEYQGAHHKDGARHRDDVARDQRLRNAGLETFEVVGGDLDQRELVVERMVAARARSAFQPERNRAWTLEKPAWWSAWASARGLAA